MSTIRRFLDSQSRAVVAAGAIMVAAAALWITSDYRDWIAFGVSYAQYAMEYSTERDTQALEVPPQTQWVISR